MSHLKVSHAKRKNFSRDFSIFNIVCGGIRAFQVIWGREVGVACIKGLWENNFDDVWVFIPKN